jgi:putative membrane protein
MVLMGVLGALITFAGRALYAPHWLTTQPWDMSPLQDQQIAGIIMWAPASAIYLLAAMVLLYRWIGSDEEPQATRA